MLPRGFEPLFQPFFDENNFLFSTRKGRVIDRATLWEQFNKKQRFCLFNNLLLFKKMSPRELSRLKLIFWLRGLSNEVAKPLRCRTNFVAV